MSLKRLQVEINKKYKQDLMVKGSKIKDIPRFSSGSLALDLELGGGWPIGKILSVLGEYSDGKTSIVLKAVAEYQKTYPDKEVLWMDVEGAWDKDWAMKLGVKEADVWVVQPEYQQQAFDIINKAIEYDVGLVVVDSVAALVPKEEAEASFEQWNIGLAARINSKAMRGFQSTLNSKAAHLTARLNETPDPAEVPPTIILINQLRDKITSSPYKTQAEPGGRAIGFHSAVKVYLKKGDLFPKAKGNYDITVVPKAQQIKFYIEKNKTAPPKRRGFLWFYFDTMDAHHLIGSIDQVEELVRYCKDYKVLDEVGRGRYEFANPLTGEVEKIHGINNFASLVVNYPEMIIHLREQLMEKVKIEHESKQEQGVVDKKEPVISQKEGTEGSKDDGGETFDWLGEYSLAEAGPDNGAVSDSTQTSWEEVPQT